MTLDLNIFHLWSKPDGFDNVDHSTRNLVDDFSYSQSEFEHVDEFAIEYESFLVDDEPKYDVFDFNDACSMDFITKVASACHTSAAPLDLKTLLSLLSMLFWVMMSL